MIRLACRSTRTCRSLARLSSFGSFFECRLSLVGSEESVDGWIYYPHPETKPEHEQPDSVLEVLTIKLSGVGEGTRLRLSVPETQIKIHPAPDASPKAG